MKMENKLFIHSIHSCYMCTITVSDKVLKTLDNKIAPIRSGLYNFTYIYNPRKEADLTEYCKNDTTNSVIIIKDNVLTIRSCKSACEYLVS